jgi:ribosomal protein L12E/L44/L45/RPP1/RPP2
MSKLFSVLIAAVFASTLSFNATAAKHMGAAPAEAPAVSKEMKKEEKKEMKKEEKKEMKKEEKKTGK